MSVQGCSNETLGGFGVPHVGRIREGPGLPFETPQQLAPPTGDDHVVTSLAQQAYGGLSNARTATGHDDNSLVRHCCSGSFGITRWIRA